MCTFSVSAEGQEAVVFKDLILCPLLLLCSRMYVWQVLRERLDSILTVQYTEETVGTDTEV